MEEMMTMRGEESVEGAVEYERVLSRCGSL